MPNNLQVALDKSTTPWCLDIDQQNNANHVARSPNAQTITWQLTGDAAAGSFNAQSNTEPGFAWVGTAPPDGIFGTPSVSGNQITMSDLNNSASTTGTWTYQLSATIGGVVYQSNKTSLTQTTTNQSSPTTTNRMSLAITDPSIKNN
ncbi:hypothetical protein [Rhodanobacter thiooxydans]|uniref:hypothetical protein n=1 Tax=Rhodanobacter thiooxydans TaxID=416169 RepID=UPI001F3AC39E|nr:hypothetical protein [Rhodanobacter thiooxydans]